MSEKEYQNLTKIILDNFDFCELDARRLAKEKRSCFLRKPVFSLNGLPEQFRKLQDKSFLEPFYFLFSSRRSVGKVPFSLSLDDLLASQLNPNDFRFARMMPVKLIDLNARDKYLIKQKLNVLLESHLQTVLGECQIRFKDIELTKTIESSKQSLDSDPLVQLNALGRALTCVETDDYCAYLRELYYQDLYCLEQIEPKETPSPNSREEQQIILETLENAIQSRCYHKIFKSILHTSQTSNSTLNDEICLFTTNWTYSKAMLRSLRDEIESFVRRNGNLPNDQRAAQLAEKKQLLNNLTELNEESFLLFDDLDKRNKTSKTRRKAKQSEKGSRPTGDRQGPNQPDKADLSEKPIIEKLGDDKLFELYLNELALLSIDLTRDLLLFLVGNLSEAEKARRASDGEQFGEWPEEEPTTANEQLPIFKLLMDDSREQRPEARSQVISLHKDHLSGENAKIVNQLKSKLQLFINQLYHRKLLKKHLLALNHEPDVEWYLNTVWTSIVTIIETLENVDQSYLVEIFLANKRHLQSGSSFVARKYLYYIIRSLFETLYLVCSTICGSFAVRRPSGNELTRHKAKLDDLIDRAFLIHLKNELLLLLSDPSIDASIQLEPPNLTRFLAPASPLTRANLTETLSQLISLIRRKLLQCSFFSSPLYAEFVKMNERYRRADDPFERQLNANLFRVLNLPRRSGVIRDPTKVISEIIENEILMRYLNLTPKLECLEQVVEIGAQIVLGLGMKKIF